MLQQPKLFGRVWIGMRRKARLVGVPPQAIEVKTDSNETGDWYYLMLFDLKGDLASFNTLKSVNSMRKLPIPAWYYPAPESQGKRPNDGGHQGTRTVRILKLLRNSRLGLVVK
jgi:hypothetical protein